MVQTKNLTALNQKMSRAAKKDLRDGLWLGVEQTTAHAHKRVKTQFSGNPIKVRSGLTRASIREKLEPRVLRGRVGSPMRHVGTLEDGATITPQRVKVLTIPLSAARTKAGKSRGTARQIGARYESSFWATSKKGNLILFGKRGNRLTPLFVGVKRVRIKGRHVFRDTARALGLTFVRNVHKQIGKALP